MNKIFTYLHLRDVGLLELTFALTPMMSGFGFAGLPLSALMWMLLLLIVVTQCRQLKLKSFLPLTMFVGYWGFHELVIMFVDNTNLNGLIVHTLYFFSIFVLYHQMNFNKLCGSSNWVALIAIMGLLWQWGDVMHGNGVHPLEIPGLSMSEYRLNTSLLRPSSFFMEPAAYVAYMMCPLSLALMERKYLWAVIMILSIFFTTSTTGIFISFVMLAMSLIANRIKARSVITISVLIFCLFFALTHFQVFDAGIKKLENTNTETNVRLNQGPYIVSTMHVTEYIFGVPYSSSYNYCKAGRATNVAYYDDSVYMSTFWLLILRYGIIGLLLYLNIYWHIIQRSRQTLPLITCLCIVMFSSGYGIQSTYIFTLIFLLIIALNDQRTNKSKHRLMMKYK